MARHRDIHPTPVPGCFACKILGLGFQGHRARYGADPTRRHDVIAQEGPRQGQIAGWHTEHWDGRQDATVTPSTVRVRTAVHEET
jgi:hypothetical protein